MFKLQEFLSQNPFRKSLDISWKEGIPASVMQSLVDDYSIPLALFLGALGGGYLVEHVRPFHGSAILTVFLISGAARFLSHFILSKKFREVRLNAQKISSFELFFSVTGIRQQLGGRNKS